MSEIGEARDKVIVSAAGKASGIMVGSLLLSRILGLLRDTVIASKFGIGLSTDAYQIAFRVPDVIFMLIAGGGLSSAFIPVFAEYWHTDRRKQAWKVFSVVVTICSLVAVVLIVGAWIATPWIVASFAKEKVQAIPAAIQMSRIVLPAQYAFLIGSILLGTLYARKQFLGPSLAPNVYNVGIILGAAVISSTFGLGIVGVAWGAMAGAFVGNLLLPIILMLPQGGSFAPSLDLRAEGVGKFFKLLLPVILGFSLPSVVTIITQYFAAPYGAGSNTVLGLSTNLWQAPLGIFGQSLALGAFPALTQFFAEKRMDLYRDLVGKTLRTVLYLCIPSAVLMAAVAPLLVKIIYGYGRAGSDPGQLELVASCLRVYCIGIPAWCMQPVLMRAFFSLHNTFKPVAIGTAMTAVFVVMCEIVTKASSNILALPWATNLAAVLLVIALMAALQGDVGKIDFAGLGEASAKSTMAALPMGVIAYAGTVAVAPHGKLASIGWFVALAAVSGIAFVGASRMLKIPEAAYLDRALARLKRSGPGDPRGTA